MKTKKISENVFQIEKEGKMNVPGVVFASEKLFDKIKQDKTLEQVKNVAMLPGIVGASMAMPDAHQGYGFCVGGVAAFELEKGIISPGGIGYDINCGVRLLRTGLKKTDFLKKSPDVLDSLYKAVPSGVGNKGEFSFSDKEMNEVLKLGSEWVMEKGYATKEDMEHTEDGGRIEGADVSKVSGKARGRGRNQLGSMGAGNHFLEVQFVEKVFDLKIAKVFGLSLDDVVVLIHTGSRGLGHQVASDYIKKMEQEYGTKNLPDRELACAPLGSQLGKDYFGAMACAANFAFANRQLITYQIRKVFSEIFKKARVEVVYDIAHNIAKFEEFVVNGHEKTLCVHRKGATRSFGLGRKEIPKDYRKVGCPIFIPGSMGTYSYVLVGTVKAREISFASAAHGSGRVWSRHRAKEELSVSDVKKELADYGVLVKSGSEKGIVEEAPQAYKDVNEVVRVSGELGLGNAVVRLRPLGVVKG